MLGGDDWPTWRETRLRALLDSPSAFGSTYAREIRLAEPDWRRRLEDPGAVSVLVLDDGRPVGMGAAYQDRPGWLHVVAMWTDPSARGSGVARDVLAAIERWAGERHLHLHLDVSTTNPVARTAYERYGFRGTGETRPLREGSTERVERMVLG